VDIGEFLQKIINLVHFRQLQWPIIVVLTIMYIFMCMLQCVTM